MTVGALIDLGVEKEYLLKVLEELPITGYEIHIEKEIKKSIEGTAFRVILKEESHNHQHHGEHHEHFHHSHHLHRNLADIYEIIHKSKIPNRAKEIAKGIFKIVARAEAKAHGVPIEEVHFHEVGAVDSIIDIVATAVCIERLGIENIAVSVMYEGQGHVSCQHGSLPIPVPAVVNILQEYHLPIQITKTQGEMITPTGAAIAAFLKNQDNFTLKGEIQKVGIGVGSRDFEHANILRGIILETKNESKDDIWILESNIDDTTGEALSYTMEKLFEAGAKDVYYAPIYMKKNRPAHLLNVVCPHLAIEKMEDIIFCHTTTIGIRKYPIKRKALDRTLRLIKTQFGECKVKICTNKNQTYYYPEYESVRRLCEEYKLDFKSAYTLIHNCAREQLKDEDK